MKKRCGIRAYGIEAPVEFEKQRAKSKGRIHGLQHSGDIAIAYLRGYQGGYEDRVMGKPPEHYANTCRKDIRRIYGKV